MGTNKPYLTGMHRIDRPSYDVTRPRRQKSGAKEGVIFEGSISCFWSKTLIAIITNSSKTSEDLGLNSFIKTWEK